MKNELKRSSEFTSAVKMATSGLGILVSNFWQFNCNLLALIFNYHSLYWLFYCWNWTKEQDSKLKLLFSFLTLTFLIPCQPVFTPKKSLRTLWNGHDVITFCLDRHFCLYMRFIQRKLNKLSTSRIFSVDL